MHGFELAVQQDGLAVFARHEPKAGRQPLHALVAGLRNRFAARVHEGPIFFTAHRHDVTVAHRRFARAQHLRRHGPAALRVQQAPPAGIARPAYLRGQVAGRRRGQHHHAFGQRGGGARRGVDQARRRGHLHRRQLLAGHEAPRAGAQREGLDHLALPVDQHIVLVVFNQRGAFGVKARGRGEARLDDPLALGVDIAPQVALADGGQAILKRRGLRVGGRDGHAALLVDIAPGTGLVAARPGQHAGQAFAEGLMADRVRALAVVAGGALVQPGVGTRRIGQGGQGQRHGQRQGLDRGAHHANTRAGAAKRGKPSRTCHMVVCLARICEGSTVTSSSG